MRDFCLAKNACVSADALYSFCGITAIGGEKSYI